MCGWQEWNTSLEEYLALKKNITEWIEENKTDLTEQNQKVDKIKTIEEAEELLRKLHSFRDVEMETKEVHKNTTCIHLE